MINYCQGMTQTDVENIHETSLKILENIGIKFLYDPAIEILKKHGAKVEGKTVFISRKMVMEALVTTPSSFVLSARNSARDIEIDPYKLCNCGPFGSPFIKDLDRGKRTSTEADLITAIKLLNDLSNIDTIGHIACEPNDVDTRIRHNVITYNNLKYSDKPIMGSSLGYDEAKQSIEMAALANGGLDTLKNKKVIIAINCSMTPLAYDDKMAGALIAYAEANQPQLVCALGIAGITSPITFAGTLALQNAEILAGIVLAQCVNPGCPVVYAGASSNGDMKTCSISIGSPEFAMYSMYNSQIAKFYNLPCRNSGNITDSKMMDSQAAFESAIVGMMSVLTGGNFILHAAGILESYNTLSLEKLIIDNEMLGYFKHLSQNLEVTNETLLYDEIAQVGSGGTYITSESTLELFRDTFYMPTIANRQNSIRWTEDGCISTEQKANTIWKEMIEAYTEPALPADIDADLRKYIEKH